MSGFDREKVADLWHFFSTNPQDEKDLFDHRGQSEEGQASETRRDEGVAAQDKNETKGSN